MFVYLHFKDDPENKLDDNPEDNYGDEPQGKVEDKPTDGLEDLPQDEYDDKHGDALKQPPDRLHTSQSSSAERTLTSLF